jgi:putative ABC transport system permease protein
MFKNYLKVAFRNSRKNPVYTLINVVGLGVGIACCVLITIYVLNERSYDREYTYADRLYRVSQSIVFEDESGDAATTPFPLKEALINDFSAMVEDGVRFYNLRQDKISIANIESRQIVRQDRFYFTDASVVNLFDVNILSGDPDGGLDAPGSVIITEDIGRLYFGDEDPVGQTLALEGRIALTVTAVMSEWPENSHFRPDMLASFESLRSMWRNYDEITSRWRSNPVWTYVLLSEGTRPEGLAERFDTFIDQYYAEFFTETETVELNLQPLTDIWLHSNLEAEIAPNSNAATVWIFSGIALLILIIACINFVNLSTAGAIYRGREVGMRKVLGAGRESLVLQFILESMIYLILAVILAAFLIAASQPIFSVFTGMEFELSDIGTAQWGGLFLLFILLISFLSVIYPSAVLASLQPVESLRGTFAKGRKGEKLRKSLVLFQFSVTAFLLIAASTTWFQYTYLQQKDMGFDKEQVLVVPMAMTSAIWSYDAFKERALAHSGILSVTGSKMVMGDEDFLTYNITPEGFSEEDTPSFAKIFVLHDFLETMNIPLLAGRTFSEEFQTDGAQAVLISREMVDYLEWGEPADAVGKSFRFEEQVMSVIGVTENFHHTQLRRELDPLIMELPANLNEFVSHISYMKIKLAPGDPSDAIAELQEIWESVDQTHSFDYFFLDDRLNQIYSREEKLAGVLGTFSGLAILVGCLGLLGLISYSVSRRKKEIAIRKTLGLSAPGVFMLLSKDYLKLVVAGHLVALPLCWFAISRWLESFPYQISIGWYLFITLVASLLITMAISLLTISSQSLKAAMQNPTESLKGD